MQKTDKELLEKIRFRDVKSFETLLIRYQPKALAIATRFLGSSSAARDAVQDVFLAVWEGQFSDSHSESFAAYLSVMVLNRCRNVKRAQAIRHEDTEATSMDLGSIECEDPEPSLVLLRQECAQKVQQKLLNLGPAERRVITMRYMQDASLEQIATETGMPLGTVKSHLSRAIVKLRNLCFGEDYLWPVQS